jgi:uncharacterized protein
MGRREIGRGECFALLARAKVGRVVLVRGALPEVVPVSYVVAGETVVFGVHSAARIAQEMEGSVVAFQVDAFDPERRCGWHVWAVGSFRPALTSEELAVAGATVPQPWTIGGELERVLQIELEVVNGYVVGEPEAE